MPRDIDPKSDFAFKLLFGAAENVDLLLNLITAIVRPRSPIVELRHVDPSTRAAFAEDDVTIVDVAARDADGALYQVEIQVNVRPVLRNRIIYASSDVLQGQIQRGSAWDALRPVIAIWILGENLFHDVDAWRHRFRVRSDEGVELSRSLEIHVVELRKWRLQSTLDDADRWAYFLRDANAWDRLPEACASPPLEKAMSILDDIAKDQALFAAHRRKMAEIDRASDALERARLQEALAKLTAEVEGAAAEAERAAAEAERAAAEAERAAAEAERATAEAERATAEAERATAEAERATAEAERATAEAAHERAGREHERAEKERERAEKERERAEKERERAERERLVARMRAAGLDPDA